MGNLSGRMGGSGLKIENMCRTAWADGSQRSGTIEVLVALTESTAMTESEKMSIRLERFLFQCRD